MGAMKSALASLLGASLVLLATVPGAWADDVRFPLTVDYDVLRTALRKHVQAQPGGRMELWRSADGCGSFVMKDAWIEPAEAKVKIVGPASASAGVPFFGLCWANVSWTGYVQITARPEIGADWHLHLRDLAAQ